MLLLVLLTDGEDNLAVEVLRFTDGEDNLAVEVVPFGTSLVDIANFCKEKAEN